MVRISKASSRRGRRLLHPSSSSSAPYHLSVSSYLTNHFFLLFLVALVLLCVSLYYFVLSSEERGIVLRGDHQSGAGIMVAATSAAHILNSGKPFLVYGTAWKKEQTAHYVSQAIHAGFRFIDTACQPKHYNEAGVGEGWSSAAKDLGLERSDFYLQTKFTPYSGQDPNNIPYDPEASLEDQVKTSLEASLRNLKTTYLDALVLHSPLDNKDDTLTVWRTMESFVDQGKVKRLGMSNSGYGKFTKLYEAARVKPSVLQNRFYDQSNFDTELREFCRENGIHYQSFWTLTANRDALNSRDIRAWAESLDLTPQQLMFAFLMSLPGNYVTPLSGTTSVEHMAQDIAIMERIQGGEVFFKTEEDLRRFAEYLGMPDL